MGERPLVSPKPGAGFYLLWCPLVSIGTLYMAHSPLFFFLGNIVSMRYQIAFPRRGKKWHPAPRPPGRSKLKCPGQLPK